MIGVAHTLSDVARWRIDTEDGPGYVDVSELPPEAFEVPRRNLGETFTALELLELSEPPERST